MRPGDVVAGRFVVQRLAGSGGMASVFRALDRETGASVALKVVHGTRADDPDRMAREARVLADLAHPGVVRYLTHGSTDEGLAFLVMEWLGGEDLGARLGRGRLAIVDSVHLGRRVGEALGMAHRRGIVHRDIKPTNLFLVEGDPERVKVLDFGIARLDGSAHLTSSRVTVGTPGYMAPEQARGAAAVDARADVFALGCVLFECLAGRPAFVASHAMAVLGMILFEDTPRVRAHRPDVPLELDELVARMMAKAPEERFADGEEAAAALAALSLEHRDEPSRGGEAQPRTSITRHEQRVVSVVVASVGPAGSAATVPMTLVDASANIAMSLHEAVRLHGARLEQLADGSLVAVLPSSDAPTQQVARAARCALAMRAALPGYPMILATGRGMLDDRPVGEVIDRAVGALLGAPTEGVGVDEATAALLDERFEVFTREPELFQGAATDISAAPPAHAWDATVSSPPPSSMSVRPPAPGGVVAELLSERAFASGLRRTVLGRPTACVGRERELSVLEAAWKACRAGPAATAVLLVGPAGTGKSRITQELLQRIRHSGDEVALLHARSGAFRGGAYAMLAPAVRRWAGILDGEPLPAQRQKLARVLERAAGAAGMTEGLEFVGEIAGVPFDEAESVGLRAARRDRGLMADRVRDAWRTWLRAVCNRRPLLLVLEDLDRGDRPTVELVGAALRALSDAPFLVIAQARPELFDAFPRLWDGLDRVDLHLGALGERACERLVREVLPAAGAVQVATIVARASGNPLFLEELLRASAGPGEHTLSATVLGMVEARLAALESEARRVLRAASVFGGAFWRGGVAALLGDELSATGTDEWLTLLEDAELVRRRDPAAFLGEVEYVFRHDLVREAAYAMLPEDDRALGHRLAAAWLEAAGERDASTLAEHLERGGELERAAHFYRRAAEESLEANDFERAVERAERGVDCGARGGLLGSLRLVQAEAFGWQMDGTSAVRAAHWAAEHLPAAGVEWFRAQSEVVFWSATTGQRTIALEAVQRMRSAEPTEPAAMSARLVALCRAVSQACLAGEQRLAVALLGEIEAALEEVERDPGADADPILRARVRQARGFTRFAADELEGALEAYLDAARVYGEARAERDRHFSATLASFVQLELGQFAEAEALLRDALAASERLGVPFSVALARINLAFALARRGRLEEAVRTCHGALPAPSSSADLRFDAGVRGFLAETLATTGDLEGAEREARRAVGALGAFPPLCARPRATLAAVLLRQGHAAEALETASEGMRFVASGAGVLGAESSLRLVHARALEAVGDRKGARDAVLAARARLLERSERIADPARRQGFLQLVPENAETVAWAEAEAARDGGAS